MATTAGRGRIPVSVFGALPRAEVIGHYAEIGVDRCVLWLPPVAEAEAISHLDRYTALMGEVARAGV